MSLYLMANGAMPTTAAFVKVTTGTAVKTMMQFKPGTTTVARIIEWGWSFDGSAAATPGEVELIETDVGATVTAYASADITKYDSDALLAGDPTTSLIAVGTAASGFTASAEGSITVIRNLAGPQLGAPTNQFVQQFPLGREPVVQPSKFARIRVTFGAAVNMYCYMIVQI
jgi:hypothetical protein